MQPILRFDGVVRRYPSFTFGPLDLEVLPGESVALAGSNGSGKSTLLRLAAGLVRADQGQVQIAGALLPRDAVAARERVALVTEDAALYAAATLRWHIELVASLVPRWDAARARGLAEAFGLDPTWRLAGLSRGQQLKAQLLLALARRPALLLLDEARAALDARTRLRLAEELDTARREDGTAVVFTSHQPEEIARLAGRVVTLDGGRLADPARAAA